MYGFSILKKIFREEIFTNIYQWGFYYTSIRTHIYPYFSQPEVPRQTDTHRSKLLSTYSMEELYQAKRKCNATQEYDINLLEGELVAVMEQKDPLGSSSRWLVDTGRTCFCIRPTELPPLF